MNRHRKPTADALEDTLPGSATPAPLDPSMAHEGKGEGHTVESVSDPEAMIALEREWERLEAFFATPLLTHNWLLSCAEGFCTEETFLLLMVRSFSRLRAAAPFVMRGGIRRRLELLGSSFTDEPGGFLFEDERALSDIIRAALALKLPLYLKGLRLASPERRILEEVLRVAGIHSLAREERLPCVRVQGRWEEFEQTISASRRSSLRRLARLAESGGKVRYEVVLPTLHNVDEYLREFFEVEASSWKSRTGTALKSYRRLGQFFRNYALLESERQRLRIFFLRLNGRAIAAQLTVVHANRLWVFKIGHDERWSWCSPGILLMQQVVRSCFDNGLEACEFLGSDESWLHIWANEFHSVVTYRIYPRAADAVVDLGADVLRLCLGRLGRKLATFRRTANRHAGEDAA